MISYILIQLGPVTGINKIILDIFYLSIMSMNVFILNVTVYAVFANGSVAGGSTTNAPPPGLSGSRPTLRQLPKCLVRVYSRQRAPSASSRHAAQRQGTTLSVFTTYSCCLCARDTFCVSYGSLTGYRGCCDSSDKLFFILS